MKRKTSLALAVIGTLTIAALAVVIYLLASRFERAHDKAPDGAGSAPNRVEHTVRPTGVAAPGDVDGGQSTTVYYNGQKYAYNDNLSTLLILGIDDVQLAETAASRNSSQADMILLAVFDPEKEICTMVQINRDTMSEVPVLDSFGNFLRYQVEQLALAHTYGTGMEISCENTAEAVSRFLYGIRIDDYFAFTMDAIPIINDLVGGVTVTVEDDFSNVDASLVKGTTVTLTAENVEHFVRARSSITEDPTNINRMHRQKVYLTGLGAALKEAVNENDSFVVEAYSSLAGSMVTDCTVEQMSNYGDRFSGYTLSQIIAPEGEAVAGEKFMEFYADEEALRELVLELFYIPVED